MSRRQVRSLVVLVVVALLAAACQIPGSGPSSERLGYDGSGRLRSVMAADGTTAVTRFDPLGNVVGIDRVAAGGVAVTSVTPSTARPGARVWVYGPGLGAGGETVSVGGVGATVEERLPGRLAVTVPAGVGSGTVEVTVGSVVAVWDGTFTPLADPPSVTALSASLGAPGDAVTISGSGFASDPLRNTVWIGGVQAPVTSASPSSLVVEVPPVVAAGRVRVETEFGSGVSDGGFATVPPGVTVADACVSTGDVGAAVATSCASGLAAIDGVAAGGVYDVRFGGPCTGTVGAGRVWAPAEGVLLVLAPRNGTGGGGSAQVVACRGSCVPPDPHPVTNNPNHLCSCFALIANVIIDSIVGRNRWDCFDCDPVDLASGQFVEDKLDLSIGDAGSSLALTRSSASSMDDVGPFGVGGTHNFNVFLSGGCAAGDVMTLHLPNGGQVPFERFGGGFGCGHLQFIGENWDRAAAVEVEGPWFGSVLTWHGAQSRGGYARITRSDGTVFRFSADGSLERITDRSGAATTIVRRARANGASPQPIAAVVSPTGRWLEFDYEPDCDTSSDACRVSEVHDSAGRSVFYEYDAAKRLTDVVDAGGRAWEYRYEDGAHPSKRTHVVAQPENVVVLENTYDAAGRVAGQTMTGQNPAALPTWTFDYTESGGVLTAVEMTNPAGVVQRVELDAEGWVVADERFAGTSAAQTTTYVRTPGSGLVTASTVTDAVFPGGRTTTFDYDPSGTPWSPTGSAPPDDQSLVSMTVESSGGDLTQTWSYSPWSFGQVRSHTAPGAPNATTYSYDAKGDLTGVTDPDGFTTVMTPGAHGLPASVKAAAATASTDATWSRGLLRSVTDPTGYTSRFHYDAAGRTIVNQTPAGNRHVVTYNPDNTIASETDPTGATTTYGWGRWGLEAVTAPGSGGTTSFDYNAFGSVERRTDPFNASETWSYLDDGRLAAHVDRTGTRTEVDYEPGTARMNNVRFDVTPTGEESSLGYAWDGAGRLTDVVDSTGRSVSFDHDDLDRVIVEEAVNGTVSYGFDPATARAVSVTPSGSTATSYTWTDGGRLDQVTHGAETTAYDYDDQGRLQAVTYPSGAGDEVVLDDSGRLTNLRLNHVVDGTPAQIDRSITWGPDGHIESLGTNNPYRVTPTYGGASHDRYRLTAWDGTGRTYDANGNTETAGDQVYDWNARGELQSVTGPDGEIARYHYDALGRRVERDLGGDITRYLHRGDTPIVERDAADAVVATYTLGPGLDDRLAQSTAAGTANYHRDHLGSTVALSDSAGTIATNFTYTPQGQTFQSLTEGSQHRTDYRYAGLPEDTGTGLIHMRARYYAPKTARFISEDPLGTAAGPNPYQYLWGNPLAGTDPHGTIGPLLAACAVGAIAGAGMEYLSSNKTSFSGMARSAAIGCVLDMAGAGIAKHLKRALTRRGGGGIGDDVVSLYRAPQRGQTTGPLNPADFPGRGGAVPDGRVYLTPNRELAEVFKKSYGNGIIRIDIPRSSYDRMIKALDGVQDAGVFRYQGGPLIEVAVPRWLVPWLNKFPTGPG